jgi:hypothetical protein
MHQNLRAIGRACRLRQRSAGWLCRQSWRGEPRRRRRRRRVGAGLHPPRPLRPMARYRRHLQSHGGRTNHRRLRHRRLGDPPFHASGTRSRPRGRRRWIGRLGARLRDRAFVLCGSGLELVAHRHRLELWNRPHPLAAALAPRMGAESAGLPAFCRGRSRAPGQFQMERASRLGAARDRRGLPRVGRLPTADNAAPRGAHADGAVGSGRLGNRWPRYGVRRHGPRYPLARRNRHRVRRPGNRVLRPRLHHSRESRSPASSARASGSRLSARSSCGQSWSGGSSTITRSGGAL